MAGRRAARAGVRRVLVVDDEALIRALLAYALREQGYEVAEAADGAEGLAAALASRPDAVVTDVCMPGLDGVGLLAALSAHGMADVPAVAISAAPRPEGLVATRFLAKPFDLDELLAMLADVVPVGTRGRRRVGADGAAASPAPNLHRRVAAR